jgi:hypothetical protein
VLCMPRALLSRGTACEKLTYVHVGGVGVFLYYILYYTRWIQ